MSVHDICITEMQQQDVEANKGNVTYNIRIHPLKNGDEDDVIKEEMITLNEGMTIRELKSYILSITKKPFFFKFHMDNDEKLDDLIKKTMLWNDQRGISNED